MNYPRIFYLGVPLLLLVAALAAFLLSGALTSRAVQAPVLSIDTVTTTNTYIPSDDPGGTGTPNRMDLGVINNCLEAATGNNAAHLHTFHVVVQNIEDMIGWQVRLNYLGDRMRPNTVNFIPFADSGTGQNISFVNLPIDSTSLVHRDLVSATSIPPAAAGPQTAGFGSTYVGAQTFPISPDTPAKTTPDDSSYSAPTGGVLASFTAQVIAGNAGQASLFLNLDDSSPNGPGSGVAIFNGTTSQDVLLPVTSLGDAYHGEGTTCVPLDCTTPECPAGPPTRTAPSTPTPPSVTPTPTAPAGTPTPTPTPIPPGPGGVFNPQVSASYSSTAPESQPDITGALDIGFGDYNFAGIVNFSPSSPADADVPNSALLGTVNSTVSLGILNNPCTTPVLVPFTLMEGTTDINDVVHMLPFGVGNELGPMAGDNPPFEGVQAVKPPPAVTKYPSFLNAIFDHDWVDSGADKIPGNGDDNNGPQPPIRPRFRAVGTTWVGFAALWVILQQVVFDPGTDLPNLPPFDPALGYPSVTVLQTSSAAGSATPPIVGPITDFCTPLRVDTNLFGLTGDNTDTLPIEGGVPLRTLPSQPGTPLTSIFYGFSQRDADGDSYENTLDPCPFNADTVWSPRNATFPPPGDSDIDGIPDTCDPSPTGGGFDQDGDGYPNRGDNCPLVPNGFAEEGTPAGNQKDTDKNAAGEEVGDGIGDACDPNPGTPDGAEIVCIRLSTITVGGPGQAAVSECLQEIPPPSTPTPTPTPTPPRIPLTLTLDRTGTVSPDGFHVGLSGTFSCTAGNGAFLNVNAFQFARGQVLLSASGFASFNCSGSLQNWAITAESFTGFFKPGHANVRAHLSTFGPGGFDQRDVAVQVRLRRGLPQSPPQSPPIFGSIGQTAGVVGGTAFVGVLAAGMTIGFVRVVRRSERRDHDI